ncbi:MAG: hypothetical protein R2810_10900 [Flavobacteriales bacterium]
MTSDGSLARGFQFLSLAFSLPVMLFASTDFFRSAWAGLRTRQVNIDQPVALGILALFLRRPVRCPAGHRRVFRFPGGPGVLPARWSLVPGILHQALSFDRALEAFLPLVVLRRKGGRAGGRGRRPR